MELFYEKVEENIYKIIEQILKNNIIHLMEILTKDKIYFLYLQKKIIDNSLHLKI